MNGMKKICSSLCCFPPMYVCMYACMYVWMHVCIYTYMHTHVYVYVCYASHRCMYACICIYICMHICVYTLTRPHQLVVTCQHTCMYVYIPHMRKTSILVLITFFGEWYENEMFQYVCIHVCMYVYTNIPICLHTLRIYMYVHKNSV
jgi:hypothetical protein